MVWHRVWGAGCVALGALLLLIGAGVLLTLPDELREQRDFLAAKPCQDNAAASPARQAAEGPCLDSLTVTVAEVIEHGGGRNGPTYELRVVTEHRETHRLTNFGGDPLVKRLKANDKVTVTTYQGKAVKLSHGGVTQQAGATPDFGPIGTASVGSMVTTGAGWLLYVGLRVVTAARRVTRLRVQATLFRLLPPFLISLLGPLACVLPARGAVGALPLTAVLVAWAVVGVLTVWFFRNRLRPGVS